MTCTAPVPFPYKIPFDVNVDTPVPPSATAKSVVNVNEPNLAAAGVIVKFPVDAPVNEPVAAVNTSADSSQPINTLSAESPILL